MELDGEVAWRVCKACGCWVIAAYVNGVLTALDPDAVTVRVAAQRLVDNPRLNAFRIVNDYAHFEPKPRLAQLVRVGSELTLHTEHRHRPPSLVSPRRSPPRREEVLPLPLVDPHDDVPPF